MTHDEIRHALPAFALGALDPDERSEVAAHLSACEACRAELAAEERTVQNIGLEALPVTPPAGLKARVLARVAAEPAPPLPVRSASARSFWASGLPLAASLILAIGASIYAFALRTELAALRVSVNASTEQAARLRQEVVTLRRDWATLTRAMDVLKAPDMLRVELNGQAQAPGATGRAFWSKTAGLVFTAGRLPALPAGRVYQLWSITGNVATSAGVFTLDATGAASVTTAVPAGAPRPNAFGVTIEPTGGSPSPTLPIVLLGSATDR